MTPTDLVKRLTQLNGEQAMGWRVIDGALEKRFGFADFHHTMAFVNAVAHVAHRLDHHPELRVTYNACVVRWWTHDAQGLSERDFDAAARVDTLID